MLMRMNLFFQSIYFNVLLSLVSSIIIYQKCHEGNRKINGINQNDMEGEKASCGRNRSAEIDKHGALALASIDKAYCYGICCLMVLIQSN